MIKHEEAEESESSSVNESDCEDSDKDSSTNSKEKNKQPIQKKNRISARPLPEKFSFRERKYKRKLTCYIRVELADS